MLKILKAKYVTMKSGNPKIQDENGELWDIFAYDGGLTAINGSGKCGLYRDFEIIPVDEGYTFGLNCHEEFVVKDGQWVQNE